LITDPDAGVADIAAVLDALDGRARWALLSGLGRAEQRALYRKADADAMDLAHLVAGAGSLVEVIHDGLNTLPVPPPIRRFQKRFCRPDGSTVDRLFGYNEGPTRRLLGPGYFVALPTAAPDIVAPLADDRRAWRERGGVVVDYFQVPDAPVAPGWPRVVPNSRGLQRFVYHGTRDFVRRVSEHVSIGAAYKGERALDHYFILCRRA
jgi:hypothetical protein